jgi:NTE family protein
MTMAAKFGAKYVIFANMKKLLSVLTVISILASICGTAFAETAADIAERGPLAASGAAAGNLRGGIVLVLSGGGTKGFAHVGVLKVLERERIPVAGIVGTSIGAVVGGLYACGYTADEIRTIIRDTNVMGLLADSGTRIKSDAGDHRPVGENVGLYHLNFDKDLRVKGPLGMLPALSLASFLTKYTGHLQTTDFNDLPRPFACVAADLGTGDEVVLRSGNLASSIRASASIPGLMEPWPIDGRLLVDGGLVANVPVAIAKEIFPGYPVVAVNLAGESISKPRERFRSVIDVMMQTIDIMTMDRIKANEAMADLVLYPEVGAFGMLDSSGYDEVYMLGIRAADANIERLAALSASSRSIPAKRGRPPAARIVRNVRIEGLAAGLTADLEKNYRKWIGKPYDLDAVNAAQERISKIDEVAAVDVDTYPLPDDRASVDVVFTAEKRPAFEFGFDGYTSSMHPHRWVSLNLNARDLSSYGDAANVNIRLGNDEWGGGARYFTPLVRGGQWGFSLAGSREWFEPAEFGSYSMERYSARALYYRERMDDFRFGIGAAGEYADAPDYERFSWGPYLYFNRDTLDNLLVPSKGYSFNSQLWLNDDNIFVSRTNLTAYIPWKSNLRFLLNFGLETGERDNATYRVLLGDREELLSLAKHPLAGDQAAWARVGLSRDFYNSWWGAVRGDIFATYGTVLESWDGIHDAWEAGVALSFPGQMLNGRIVLVYSSDGEIVFGFSLGNPRWHSSPLP